MILYMGYKDGAFMVSSLTKTLQKLKDAGRDISLEADILRCRLDPLFSHMFACSTPSMKITSTSSILCSTINCWRFLWCIKSMIICLKLDLMLCVSKQQLLLPVSVYRKRHRQKSLPAIKSLASKHLINSNISSTHTVLYRLNYSY